MFDVIHRFLLNDIEYLILENKYVDLDALLSDEQFNIISKLPECSFDLRKCINKIDELKLYSTSDDIKVIRKNLNEYLISSTYSNAIHFITPFTFDENWNSQNNIFKLGKYLQTVRISKNQNELMKYFDKLRFYMKLTSIFIFLSLTLIIIIIKLRIKIFLVINKNITKL